MHGLPHPSRAASAFRRIAGVFLQPFQSGAFVLGAFAVLYLGLQVYTAGRRSATFDEPIHLAAGYAALKQGEFRFEPTHPPLLRMWAALPFLALDVPPPAPPPLERVEFSQWEPHSYYAAYHFLHDGGRADELLAAARFMTILWGLGLGVLVYVWTRELAGPSVGALVLLFYLLEPNLAAHFSLTTTDGGVTFLMAAAAWFFWRLHRRWHWGNVAGASLCLGLALAAKYSAILLIPALVLVLPFSFAARGLGWRRALLFLGVAAAASWLVIWAAYGFRYLPAAGTDRFDFARTEVVRSELGWMAEAVGRIDAARLLPNAYTQGFLRSQATARALGGYALGDQFAEGRWYYFPVAFLVKTPVALLAAYGGGLACAVWQLVRRRNREPLVLLAPAAVYLGFAMASGVNIGFRHLLPVLPFLLVSAGGFFRLLLETSSRWGRPVLGALATAAVVLTAHSFPSTLSFFNILVGGPARGGEYLSDSNLDWGQHLKLLRDWLNERDIDRINLAYFGSVDPAYYGIDYVALPGSPAFRRAAPPELPGYVAVSQTIRHSPLNRIYEPLARLDPVASIGHTIDIYWVEDWPLRAAAERNAIDAVVDERLKLADEMHFLLGWHAEAVRNYRLHLDDAPHDWAARARLGVALISEAEYADGEMELRRAIETPGAPEGLADEIHRELMNRGEADLAFRILTSSGFQAAESATITAVGVPARSRPEATPSGK